MSAAEIEHFAQVCDAEVSGSFLPAAASSVELLVVTVLNAQENDPDAAV